MPKPWPARRACIHCATLIAANTLHQRHLHALHLAWNGTPDDYTPRRAA